MRRVPEGWLQSFTYGPRTNLVTFTAVVRVPISGIHRNHHCSMRVTQEPIAQPCWQTQPADLCDNAYMAKLILGIPSPILNVDDDGGVWSNQPIHTCPIDAE